MKTITVENLEGRGFTVRQGDRYCDRLNWDEMVCTVVELTHPKLGEARYRMRTEEEWADWDKRIYQGAQA